MLNDDGIQKVIEGIISSVNLSVEVLCHAVDRRILASEAQEDLKIRFESPFGRLKTRSSEGGFKLSGFFPQIYLLHKVQNRFYLFFN